MFIARLTLRSLRARWIRFALTSLAVVGGVAAVVASFVLSDTLRKTFESVADSSIQNIDVVVRAIDPLAGEDAASALRAPLPDDLVDQIAAVNGVRRAEGQVQFFPAITTADAKTIETAGAPIFGFNWTAPPEGSTDVFKIVEGRGPIAAQDIAVDAAAAKSYDLAVGDTIDVRAVGGQDTFTITGKVEFGEGGAGAYFFLFEPQTAQRLANLPGLFQSISVQAVDGVNEAELRDRVSAVLPDQVEAVTATQAGQEFSDSFGQIIDIIRNVLLTFAFVMLFVAGFVINVVFNTTLGQRIRELALLRAIGARNSQVTRSVLAESLLIGVMSSLIGTIVGIGFARLIILLITSVGGGFPDTPLQLNPSTWLVALIVGVGVTLVVSVVPAIRAGRVSPVAAMRDGATLFSDSIRWRTIAGALGALGGLAAFFVALFASFENTSSRLSLLGLGAFGVFMGATALSPLVARPIAHVLSWPFVKLFSITGLLAWGNAARNPRRTATTAAALMIGVTLVSMVGVLGSSFKASFTQQLQTGIKADYFFTADNFIGFSPDLAKEVAALPEVDQVTTFRGGTVKINGETKSLEAAQPTGLDKVLDLDVRAGTVAELPPDGVAVQDQVADEMGVGLGDTVSVQFPIGEQDLTIVALFHTNPTGSNWIVPLSVFEEHFPPDVQFDGYGGLTLKPGVDRAEAATAITSVTDKYGDVTVEDRAEFLKTQNDQIDQTALIINALLVLSLVIAGLGIVITLMLAVFERTRELGLLRAVGQLRGQTWGMVLIESMIVALFGTVLGIALGVLFGVAISSALPESVMTVVRVPYGQLVVTIIAAAIAGIGAGVVPAWWASRLKVLDAIAYE